MLAYIFQMLLCSAILYGYYHLFLRNGRFHQYNRFYLLSIIVLSLLLPLVKIPVVVQPDDVIYQPLDDWSLAVTVVAQKSPSFLNAFTLLAGIYVLLVLVFSLRIFISLRKIFMLKKSNPSEDLDGVSFIQTSHPATPFSFFKWLFWNRSLDLNSDQGRHVFRHEMYHIEKKHSWDLVFAELITALFWFNPIFYLVRREIKIIQEFLADQYATNEENISAYAELLLMQTFGSYNHRLVNPFFHNQLKRRIAMLTKSKKPAYQYLRKLMVLPLVAVATLLFAFTYNKEINEVKEVVEKKIASIDATVIPAEPEVKKEIVAKPLKDTVPAKKTGSKNFRFDTEKKNYGRLPEVVVVGYSDDNTPTIEPPKDRVDIHASYPGGATDWTDFIERNIRGDVPRNLGARPGNYNAAVRFIVEPDGSLSNFEPITDQGYGMEEEIIRVLKKSGKWKPALNNKDGETKPVRAYRTQPVTFQVINKNQQKPTETSITELPKIFNEEIFTKVEKDAAYPGGAAAWRNFLERNLRGEVPVDNGAGPGNYTVITQFVVDRDGNVSDVKAISNLGYGMEEEAARVIKKSGKWTPAVQNGRNVNAYTKKPITFQVLEQ